MNYRVLGRTGLKVSEIALGCEGFNGKSDADAKELFNLALSCGVNCMDLYTPNPEVHRHVADAIQGRRAEFSMPSPRRSLRISKSARLMRPPWN